MAVDSRPAMSVQAPPIPGQVEPEPELSLVICTLNEAGAIGRVLDEARSALQGLAYEIIVVDDGSTDGTDQEVAERAAEDPRVRLIVREGVRGLASAAVRGWDEARGRRLALMDGDGQHDPRLVAELLGALQEQGADLAVASRYAQSGPSGLTGRRAWLSRAGTRAAGLLLRAPLSDPMSGCFVMTRAWYEAARPRLSAVGFKILVDLVASSPHRPRVVERPAALRTRFGGQSKLDARVVADLGGLIAEKWTGGLIPARFVLFAMVGASGVLVNLALLWLTYVAAGIRPFWAAQALAVFGAIVWNFVLNDRLTFRDQRLRGKALLRGFVGFVAACLAGAAFNELVAAALHGAGARWGVAGLAGAFAGGIWNFWAVRRTTWQEARPPGSKTSAQGT